MKSLALIASVFVATLSYNDNDLESITLDEINIDIENSHYDLELEHADYLIDNRKEISVPELNIQNQDYLLELSNADNQIRIKLDEIPLVLF